MTLSLKTLLTFHGKTSVGMGLKRLNLKFVRWVAARLPLGDALKGRILAADSVVQRLRMELSFLEQCQVLVCRYILH